MFDLKKNKIVFKMIITNALKVNLIITFKYLKDFRAGIASQSGSHRKVD